MWYNETCARPQCERHVSILWSCCVSVFGPALYGTGTVPYIPWCTVAVVPLAAVIGLLDCRDSLQKYPRRNNICMFGKVGEFQTHRQQMHALHVGLLSFYLLSIDEMLPFLISYNKLSVFIELELTKAILSMIKNCS